MSDLYAEYLITGLPARQPRPCVDCGTLTDSTWYEAPMCQSCKGHLKPQHVPISQWDGIHTPYSEVVKLSVKAQEVEHVLHLIVARAQEAQGKWVGVEYAPDWCDPYRNIIEIAERAL